MGAFVRFIASTFGGCGKTVGFDGEGISTFLALSPANAGALPKGEPFNIPSNNSPQCRRI